MNIATTRGTAKGSLSIPNILTCARIAAIPVVIGCIYAQSIAELRKAQSQLAPIADYTAYYLAAARVESKDFNGIAESLRPVYAAEVASPFAARKPKRNCVLSIAVRPSTPPPPAMSRLASRRSTPLSPAAQS